MAKKKKRWVQKVKSKIEKKGTKGAFRAYCQSKGYTKVTQKCIEEALREARRTGNTTLAKRAALAKAFAKMRKKRKK